MEQPPSMGDQFLSTINQIIEDNLDNENFSVEDLAQNAGLSRSMLHRKLIKLTGKSAGDLISETRLNRARELLENDVATASEIAYMVGFNSPSYFNKVFKEYFHVSPGDVRKGVLVNLNHPPNKQKHKIQVLSRLKIHDLGIKVLIILLIAIIVSGGLIYLFRVNKPVEKSIAILPFINISSDKENQYFADGIVEDLLNRLSTIDDLKVISRTSSEMFRNKGNKSVPEIADILGVNYILEGSVQREVDNMRISIQLIDAHKDDHILSKQYDRDLSEIFKIQSEIASQIASELSILLTEHQLNALMQNQTNNLKAFNYYQMGRYHLNRRSKEEFLSSIDCFNRAINEDSNYALAYAGLADAYYNMSWHRWIDDVKAGRDTALKLALKALEIDDNLVEAHTVLGGIYQEMDWNMEEAEDEYKKAIRKNHNYSPAYQYYAELLSITGRPEQGREYINKAIVLDPFSFTTRNVSTMLYMNEGNYAKALEENQMCLELVKDHPWAIDRNFFIYLGLENEEAAVENFKKNGIITGEYTPQEADSAYMVSGIDGLLRLKSKTYNWPAGRAYCYTMLGEDEKAIEMLEVALDEFRLHPYEMYNIHFKNLQKNPKFRALKKKLGLQRY